MTDQPQGAPWWNPEVRIPDLEPEFSLDPVMMQLMIESLPPVQGWHDDTARYWLEQAERDVYLETVESRGSDPLERSDWGTGSR
jgi:hypothetical protein